MSYKSQLKNSEFIKRVKSRAKCMDCGNHDTRVLEFDHVKGDKLFQIGGSWCRFGRKKIKEEMRKCEIVCANCHSIRTSQRRKNNAK